MTAVNIDFSIFLHDFYVLSDDLQLSLTWFLVTCNAHLWHGR